MLSDSSKYCSMPNCDKLPRLNQRYCPECHSKYMRAWRAKRKRRAEETKAELVRLRKRVMELEHGRAT
jgi:hypothetical protein